jgi:hypothetical protein
MGGRWRDYALIAPLAGGFSGIAFGGALFPAVSAAVLRQQAKGV